MITRRSIQRLIDEVKALSMIADLAEYNKAKDRFLERTLPILLKSRRTRPLAEAMKSSLKIGYYIPAKDEASLGEIEAITQKARAELAERIITLEGMADDTVRADLPLACLALIFLTGGIITLLFINTLLNRAGESADWPWAGGRLLKSGVAAYTGSTMSGRLGTRTGTTTYGLDVEYEYSVAGRHYRGRNFSFEPHTEDKAYWEVKAGRYRAGERVDVYYDPRNPAFAILETGDYEKNYIFITMGLIFFGVGAFFMARVIRFRYF